MKVANPKFFEDLQSKRIEDEKRYAEKVKMMYDMKKRYMDTIHKQKKMINSKLDDYDEQTKKNDLKDLYKKYHYKKR